MSVKERRLLTAVNSKLGKVDLPMLLRKQDAWETLPLEARQDIYSRLPAPRQDEEAHDPSINPLNTQYRPYIEEELRRWQDDLKDGKEVRKWREEAMLAGKQRVAGEFDEFKAAEREAYWGVQSYEEEADRVAGSTSDPKAEDTT